jgi:hypothetical protein
MEYRQSPRSASGSDPASAEFGSDDWRIRLGLAHKNKWQDRLRSCRQAILFVSDPALPSQPGQFLFYRS